MYIAVIPVRGAINMRLYDRMKGVLDYAESKHKIAGIIIHINSQGGEAVASELFYNSFSRIALKKPVYAYIEGMGASGAYWVALAASRIYAFSGSIVGSIGVVSIIPNVNRLLDKIGVEIDSVKIGEYKDALSPFASDREQGKEMIGRIMKDSYDKFTTVVRSRRKLGKSDIERIAQGQIFSVSEAIKEKLIDSEGTFDDVKEQMTKTLHGLKKFRVVEPHRPMLQRMMERVFGDSPLQSIFSFRP